MNRWLAHGLALAVLAACLPLPSFGAGPSEEERLVAVLRSNQPPAAKDAACQRLKRIGTARAVPALASLLADKQLSHSARDALESIPCDGAGAALREALAKATGALKAGLIDSLGDRRDRKAAPALAGLVGHPDPQIASSAAAALGKIAGPEALRALRAAKAQAPPAVRPAVVDALLRCAERLLAAGDRAAASALYRQIHDPREPEHVRTAAFRGLVRAAGDDAVPLVTGALKGDDPASRLAALQLARDIQGQAATKAFAALLKDLPPATQVALIEALRQRGDRAASPAIAAAARRATEPVRIAALRALAVLGDASTVELLADAAARAKGAEQAAARQALARLRGADVQRAILAHLPQAPPAAQTELALALGRRGEASAAPALLKMADGPRGSARVAAARALALLADDRAVDELIRLLAQAKTEADRAALEKALVAACTRSQRPAALGARVVAAMKGASVAARCALLRVAGRAGGPEALAAVRRAVEDPEAAIRDAAVRTMAEAGGLELAPDLLRLARDAPKPAHRVLALRGYWRVVGLASGRPAAERWRMCQAAMAAAQRPADRKLGLTELAKVPHPAALKLAEALCKDEAVRAEAEAACVQLAATLASAQPAESRAVLRRLAAAAATDALRAQARKALDTLDQFVGYVTTWQVAGPYRQKGKECRQLFDVVFPPERPGADVPWRPAPRPADPSLSWQVDLSSIVGGNHCVVYLRTRVHAPAAQPVRLDIGTDDGIKLWINGKLVHANNAVRGLSPGQDRARATLRQGWNDVLVKITQHTMGCGACVRFRRPDGSVIEGLRFDSGQAGAK